MEQKINKKITGFPNNLSNINEAKITLQNESI